MTTKLIKIDGYWIVVSDSIGSRWIFYESRDGWILEELNKKSRNSVSTQWYLQASQNPAHNLPNITFSDEVAKELGTINIYEKSEAYVLSKKEAHESSYIDGYNQCLSDNADKKFTLTDIAVAFEAGRTFEVSKHESANQIEYIQSLTKEEYFCELEMDCTLVGLGLENECKPKITNNSVKVTKIWK